MYLSKANPIKIATRGHADERPNLNPPSSSSVQVAKRYKFKAGTQGFREDHVNWFWAPRTEPRAIQHIPSIH